MQEEINELTAERDEARGKIDELTGEVEELQRDLAAEKEAKP